MRRFIFANFGKKGIDLFLCFLFLQIHSNASNKSITTCVYYVQLFLNITVSYAYKCPNILFKKHTCRKSVPFIRTCSMQTYTYYAQTKSNLGRTMFAMIIVYITMFWWFHVVTQAISYGLVFAYYTHWNSHCWSLFN